MQAMHLLGPAGQYGIIIVIVISQQVVIVARFCLFIEAECIILSIINATLGVAIVII